VSEIKLSAGGVDGRADRVGTEAAPRTPRRNGTVSRHGAISRELTKYSNYKLWADKVRIAWRIENGEMPPVPVPTPGTTRR